MKAIIFTLTLFSILFYVACQKQSTGVQNQPDYAPLSVGDEWQMVDLTDSSTTWFKVVSTKQRQDGRQLFLVKIDLGNLFTDTLYFYKDQDFLIYSDYDPNRDPEFLDIFLAPRFPEDGDSWHPTGGKSTEIFWKAHYLNRFMANGLDFNDVFQFEMNNPVASWPLPVTYYAPNFGHLATAYKFGLDRTELRFICTYKKISGKVYGSPWPVKNHPILMFDQMSPEAYYRMYIEEILGVR